jgi:hypothetical protein
MSNNIKGVIGMTESVGAKLGILGRRTIRSSKPGSKSEGPVVGLWDIKPKPGSRAEALQRVYLDSLSAVDQAEARKASALASGKLTPDGVKSDLLTFGAQKLAPVLYRGRQVVEAAKREVADKRSQIKLQPADKTDLAGAMRRAELRDWLRNKSEADRSAYLREHAESLAPEIALAMLEMPAEVSGISQLQHSAMVDRVLEATHGEAISEIKQLERAIELAEKAVELGRGEIIKESESSVDDFNAIAEPFEARSDAPWLKKFIENGQEVVRTFEWNPATKNGAWRIPTDEQLAVGIVAESHDQYLNLKSRDVA